MLLFLLIAIVGNKSRYMDVETFLGILFTFIVHLQMIKAFLFSF